MNYFLAIVVLLTGASSVAAAPAGMAEIANTSSLWRLFLALGLLIALIPLVIWGLKRLQGLQHKFSKSEIAVVASQSVGPKERIILVEVDGRRLLLGATTHSITCLKELGSSGDHFAELMDEQLKHES